MSITYHIKPEHRLIILVHTGSIPDDEFLTFYKRFFRSDKFDPSMNLLVDLREAEVVREVRTLSISLPISWRHL